jgi:hypothetical protein
MEHMRMGRYGAAISARPSESMRGMNMPQSHDMN